MIAKLPFLVMNSEVFGFFFVLAYQGVCKRSCLKITCSRKCQFRCSHGKRGKCNLPCSVRLACGHDCSAVCGSVCPPCLECDGGPNATLHRNATSASDQRRLESKSSFFRNVLSLGTAHYQCLMLLSATLHLLFTFPFQSWAIS